MEQPASAIIAKACIPVGLYLVQIVLLLMYSLNQQQLEALRTQYGEVSSAPEGEDVR